MIKANRKIFNHCTQSEYNSSKFVLHLCQSHPDTLIFPDFSWSSDFSLIIRKMMNVTWQTDIKIKNRKSKIYIFVNIILWINCYKHQNSLISCHYYKHLRVQMWIAYHTMQTLLKWYFSYYLSQRVIEATTIWSSKNNTWLYRLWF